MLTVKQAKDLGVVFVEGDVVDDGVLIGVLRVTEVNSNYYFDHLTVTSFTDRKRTGDEAPRYGDLPVECIFIDGDYSRALVDDFNWTYEHTHPVVAWKPDLEALEKLANEKEEKPMKEVLKFKCSSTVTQHKAKSIKDLFDKQGTLTVKELTAQPSPSGEVKINLSLVESVKAETPTQNQYTYELVTDLSTNEIAKAMIDGEVFYSKQGSFTYKWNGNRFIEKEGANIAVTDQFYRRKEITWEAAAYSLIKECNALNEDDMLEDIIHDSDYQEERKEFIKLCHLVASMTDKPE